MKHIVPMSVIKARYNPGEGRHFFDRATMRFFDSKLPAYGYEGMGGTYFVTSERFVPSSGLPHPRAYTVRRLVSEGNIDTVSEFNTLGKREARELAKHYAADGE